MNFEQISQNWQNQEHKSESNSAEYIMDIAKKQNQELKHKKLWTIGILCLTSIILITFFIYVGAYNNWTESFGLSLMIAMLLLRIIIEFLSKQHLQRIDKTLDFQTYVYKYKRYFKKRQWLHFVITPIIYLTYFGGFVSMLPVFKAELSSGFYLYILISGFVVFIGLAVFIAFHIRKELQDLQFLKHVFES